MSLESPLCCAALSSEELDLGLLLQRMRSIHDFPEAQLLDIDVFLIPHIHFNLTNHTHHFLVEEIS